MYGMDYLPEMAPAGNISEFQKGLDRRVNGRAIKESFRKLRSAPWIGEFRVAGWPGWPTRSFHCAYKGSLWTIVLASLELGFEPIGRASAPCPIPGPSGLCLTKAAKPCAFYLSQGSSADTVFYF